MWLLERLEGVIQHVHADSDAHTYKELGHTLISYKSGLAAGRIALFSLEEIMEFGVSARSRREIAGYSAMAIDVMNNKADELEWFAREGMLAAQSTLDHTSELAERIRTELAEPAAQYKRARPI